LWSRAVAAIAIVRSRGSWAQQFVRSRGPSRFVRSPGRDLRGSLVVVFAVRSFSRSLPARSFVSRSLPQWSFVRSRGLWPSRFIRSRVVTCAVRSFSRSFVLVGRGLRGSFVLVLVTCAVRSFSRSLPAQSLVLVIAFAVRSLVLVVVVVTCAGLGVMLASDGDAYKKE
jgi:hypothetical protein